MGAWEVRVLIDSSAWIDFLREGCSKRADVATLLKSGSAVLCPVTWAELWSGVRGKREETVLLHIREVCGWLEIDDTVWESAAMLGRVARGQGVNCPLTDVLVVVCARHHGTEILHRDKHIDELLALSDKPPTQQ